MPAGRLARFTSSSNRSGELYFVDDELRVGGIAVAPQIVATWEQRGELEWVSDETREWFLEHFTTTPAVPAAPALDAEPQRALASRLLRIGVITTIVSAGLLVFGIGMLASTALDVGDKPVVMLFLRDAFLFLGWYGFPVGIIIVVVGGVLFLVNARRHA